MIIRVPIRTLSLYLKDVHSNPGRASRVVAWRGVMHYLYTQCVCPFVGIVFLIIGRCCPPIFLSFARSLSLLSS